MKQSAAKTATMWWTFLDTPEGGKIELGLEAFANMYSITIEDSSEGIPESDLKIVFERFYRGKTKSGGRLGLSIAQSLINLHGGFLSVRNAREGGAEFEVRLPQL